MVIDVDGTMTDGGIYYDNNGNEYKRFNTKDAAGFFAARAAGIKTIVITGRESFATERRMKELQVDYVFQNVKNKAAFLKCFLSEHNIQKNEIGFIGDDLNDYDAMRLVSFVACPADSCREVRAISGYISEKKGGCGAVRDCIEHLLEEYGEWDAIIKKIYNTGT